MVESVGMSTQARFLRLESAIVSFTDVLRVGALDARITACPDWDLKGLTWHLGTVHRWAGRCLDAGPVDFPEAAGPEPRVELVAWFREGAAALLQALNRADPDAECWTFDPDDRTAGFWLRRQLHETVMHLWDAQNSQGSGEPLGPLVAADGVAEALEFFFPRQLRLERLSGVPGTIAVELSDIGTWRWLVGPQGAVRTQRPTGCPDDLDGADALVRGPAQAVLLALWHRLPVRDLQLDYFGNRSLAQRILASALTT